MSVYSKSRAQLCGGDSLADGPVAGYEIVSSPTSPAIGIISKFGDIFRGFINEIIPPGSTI
jgi:hypothetical protein